jgi:hypothetical protein
MNGLFSVIYVPCEMELCVWEIWGNEMYCVFGLLKYLYT